MQWILPSAASLSTLTSSATLVSSLDPSQTSGHKAMGALDTVGHLLDHGLAVHGTDLGREILEEETVRDLEGSVRQRVVLGE